MRTVPALVVAVLLASACSGQASDTTLPSASPETVVSDWLAALATLDLAALDAATATENVALLVGAENRLSTDQMTAILDGGLPPVTARSYWATFRDSIVGLVGAPFGEIETGAAGRFTVDDREFAAVAVQVGEAGTEVIVALVEDGWKVDLVATVGPALAVQLRRLVAQLVEEADDGVARRYALAAVTSLGAALARDPDNRALDLEVEAIEDLPIDLET